MLAGCNTTEAVRFQALGTSQQSIVRDGRPALVSRKSKSIVMVSPAGRGIPVAGRPVYVVGISNLSGQPVDFRVADVSVTQLTGGNPVSLQVIPYEQLVSEERTRQVIGAVLAGAAAGANSYAAARSGYGTATVYTPSGTVSESWPGKFEQPDKWIFGLTAASIALANQERP